jgi:hypothetical protein
MGSPSPVPPCSRAVVKNGRKTFSAWAGENSEERTLVRVPLQGHVHADPLPAVHARVVEQVPDDLLRISARGPRSKIAAP